MKRFTAVVVGILMAVAAFAQVDADSISADRVEPGKVDLGDARFFFQGPMDIYVDGVEYDGVEYSAVLKYDGMDSIEVTVPPEGSYIRPQELDFSNVELSLTQNGRIRVSNLIADGYRWTGLLRYAGDARFVRGGEVEAVGRAGGGASMAQVERLEGRVDELEQEIEQKDQQIQELRGGNEQVARLQDRIADRNRRIRQLENRLDSAIVTRFERLPNVVLDGFGRGRATLGSWRSGSRLRQTDSEQRFAKYVFRAPQRGNEYTYTFSGRSNQSGWVGLGVHMLASGAQTSRGYGYGDSYLIWLTRDPDTQTDSTFVQLYQSFNDVRMVQIASAAIPFDVADGVEVAVHVNRREQQMRVFVDGRYAFTYPFESRVAGGSEVVLRALGNVQFDDLVVRSR
mgnify:FL=1